MNRIVYNSKTLDELHRIRERMYEETKGMSFEEKIKQWGMETCKLLEKDGYKYLETSEGIKIFRKE